MTVLWLYFYTKATITTTIRKHYLFSPTIDIKEFPGEQAAELSESYKCTINQRVAVLFLSSFILCTFSKHEYINEKNEVREVKLGWQQCWHLNLNWPFNSVKVFITWQDREQKNVLVLPWKGIGTGFPLKQLVYMPCFSTFVS